MSASSDYFRLYSNLDFTQILTDLGSFTVNSSVAGKVTFTLQDTSFTGTFSGTGLSYDSTTQTLSGSVTGIELFQNATLAAQIAISGGVTLTGAASDFSAAWAAIIGAQFQMTASDIRMVGTAGDDSFFYRGTAIGGAGDDTIQLQEFSFPASGSVPALNMSENLQRDRAFGGTGKDTITLATDNAFANGGADDDTLMLGAGNLRVKGGAGSDTFIAGNELYSVLSNYLGTEKRLNATVLDYAAGEDTLIFAPPGLVNTSRKTAVTLEDLFGTGTLADISDFTVDRLDYHIADPANPNVVIYRDGATKSGGFVAERIVLKDMDLSDVLLSDIVVDYI